MEEENAQDPAPGPGELRCPWIEDEGLLRDEGVVFGLSGRLDALAEKESAIRAYHARAQAAESRRREALLHSLATIEAEREARTARAVSARSEALAAGPEGEAPAGMVVRYALGVATGLLACAGTAALAYEQLRPAFAHPGLVTAGVVGAGFFTAFLPVSLLFTGDDAQQATGVELWKVRLAELGLPLAAAVFVVGWSAERLGPFRAAVTGLLLFLAFAFAGRQVLSTVPRLGTAVRTLRREREERAARARDAAWTDEPRALDEAVALTRRELSSLRTDAEWAALCQTRLAIFRSEFHLAAGRSISAATLPTFHTANGSH